MSKILLVDDDIAYNEMLKDYLESQGHELSCAFDGNQAFKLFESGQPDLVITDLVMPEEDGVGLLMKLWRDDGSFPCKVITMSGGGRVDGTEYLSITKSMGVDCLLEKPFKMAELKKSIEALLH